MGCWVTRAVFMSLHFFSFSSHFICSKLIQLQASNKNSHIFSGLRLINWKSLANPVDGLLTICWSDVGAFFKTESPTLAAPTWGAPCCAHYSCPAPCLPPCVPKPPYSLLLLLFFAKVTRLRLTHMSGEMFEKVWRFFCVLGLQEFWDALKRGERSWLRRFFLLKQIC